ncbi:MAG TPA: STAS domain-containing protein [Thermodesulfovibrionales bacterium]|nr:STAS domain-containing protein [Thermodesulfovibrionales bacterium]
MTYRNVVVKVENSPSKQDLKIVTIEGSLDAVTNKEVNETVVPLIEQGAWNIIMDLSNLKYLSSTGMMCLIKYLVYSNDKQKIFKMVKPPQAVYDTLQVAGIARHFEIYDSIGEATRSFN